MRIALGQLESGTDIQANLAAIDRFAASAAADGATLVAFPEYATYEKKKVDATFPEMAEPLYGPVCQKLAATARRHRIALVAGVVETSNEPGKAYNTLVAFGPDGERRAVYRKIHLFDAQGFGESTFIKPGPSTSPVVFDFGGARFGLMTCYDLRFPELARSLADAGAQVLLVCSSWVPGTHKTEQWLALNAARAIENSLYVAGGCARRRRCPWAGACWWILWGLLKPISGWSPVFGRWMSRLRRWRGFGSCSRCSGSGGCRLQAHLVAQRRWR
ncbi:nitrilase-related carbon-nitrogen hydrolase [Arthrobacter sp. ISL-72]|uniref:nitrilase-related carbon-nitrogen hydrolase n=1 Tax=Arthrobacter sp. ISL-72 TaxID=2819114 RepID=UPI00288972AB|nr:nitrilase-related carbon-nitrogen hydrolase [Arthrobacter sp. ISL-72]